MAEQTAWARDVAAALLAPLGQRWTHTLGVVEQARAFTNLPELDVLVAAAHLHHIGYAPVLVRTGFHPLDGALFLRALGHERMALPRRTPLGCADLRPRARPARSARALP